MNATVLLVLAVALAFVGLAVVLASLGILAVSLARWAWNRVKHKNPFQP